MWPCNITFKTQLRWTAYGIFGVAVPALTTFHFRSLFVAFGMALFSVGAGMLAGGELVKSEYDGLVYSQSQLIDSSQDLIREQRKVISELQRGPIGHGGDAASQYQLL